jgi:hypothetical protein
MLDPATGGPVDRNPRPVLTWLKAELVKNGTVVTRSAVKAGAHHSFSLLNDVHIHSADFGTSLISHLDVPRPGPSQLTADDRQADHRDDGC